MDAATVLLRQVHSSWLKDGHILSLAFRPFPKDEGLLSVYDGGLIQPEPSWIHYTRELGYASAGVWGVTVGEAAASGLPARPDPEPFPEHAVIDFRAHVEKVQKAKAKILAAHAEARGCLFAPAITGPQ
jgi:hypothetical protein